VCRRGLGWVLTLRPLPQLVNRNMRRPLQAIGTLDEWCFGHITKMRVRIARYKHRWQDQTCAGPASYDTANCASACEKPRDRPVRTRPAHRRSPRKQEPT